MEGSLTYGSVPKKGDRETPITPKLGCRRCSGGDGKPSGDDPVRTKDPNPRISDMHRAATTAVSPGILAHQLGEHDERIEAFCQTMAVPSVGGGDDIPWSEGPTRADRRSFLPGGQVDESGDLSVAVEGGHPLLKTSDEDHPSMHLEKVFDREGLVDRPVGDPEVHIHEPILY